VRTVRVGAAASAAAIGASALLAEVEWDVVAGAGLLAMVVELLLCVASLPEAPFPGHLFNGHDDEST
jgi:hypothetical protein